MSSSKYKPYENYNALESTYWDRIPSKWNKDMLGRIVEIKGRIGWRGLRSDDYRDEGPILLAVGNIGHWGDLITENVTKISREAFNNSPEIVVQNNDLLISKSGTIGRTCVIEHINEDITINAAINILRCSEKIMPKFLHYWIQSSPMQTETSLLSFANAQGNLFQRDLRKLPIFSPSIPEQQKIIQFCVASEKKLRELEKNLDTQISLLEEKRSALITRAVTKGLNPGAPMKESDVDWIGKIPQHWGVIKMGKLNLDIQTGPFGSQLHSEDYVEGGTPILNATHLKGGVIIPDWSVTADVETVSRLEMHKLKSNDLIFGRRGEAARVALVSETEEGWLCGTGSIRVRTIDEKIHPDFLSIYCGSKISAAFFERDGGRATMLNLNEQMLKNLFCPLPPVEEQMEICSHISEIQNQIRSSSEMIFDMISLLGELRVSLISAAVTGKIDVRTL